MQATASGNSSQASGFRANASGAYSQAIGSNANAAFLIPLPSVLVRNPQQNAESLLGLIPVVIKHVA